MIKIRSLGMIVFLAILPAICAADAPHQLGGFVLGGNIEDFRCFKAKQQPADISAAGSEQSRESGKFDWDLLIPR